MSDMKVNAVNNTYLNFQSRNRNIRQADDIQRNVRMCFPMMSPTYMDIFYNCHKRVTPDNTRYVRAEEIVDKIDKRISFLRDMFSPDKAKSYNISSDSELDVIKKIKIGNCGERAATVVAGLAANGIYDVETASLHMELKYINKKTGECEYSAQEPVDHMLVIANLEPENKDENNKVVIDSWMGFADSMSGAMQKYKAIYNEKQLKDKLKFHRSMFRVNYAEKYNKIVDYNDFYLSTKLFFKPEEKFDENQLQMLGINLRLKYPELVVN